MPNNIQIIVDGKTATTSGTSDEPATKADPTSSYTSSKNSTKSTSSDQSSSEKKDDCDDGFLCFLVFQCFWVIGLPLFLYTKGRRDGTKALAAQIPDSKIFAEREKLQKEEERLKNAPELIMFPQCGYCGRLFDVHQSNLQNQRKKLAEKFEALDKEELQHLKERAMVLETKLETQKASFETEKARESSHEAVNMGILPDKTGTEAVDKPYTVAADLRCPGLLSGPFGCSRCSGEKADPPMREAGKSLPATSVPWTPRRGLEMNETPTILPHQDDSMVRTKPDTKVTGPPTTKRAPSTASNVVLESLSAENDATNEEMSQIKRAKEALKSREKELKAQGKDWKKRMQELNTPKSDQITPVASGMLLGSVLAFGVSMMMSVYRS